MNTIIVNAVIYAIILNVVCSIVFSYIATPTEVNPPNGAAALSFKEQIVHMFVHHNQVMLASTIIVAFVVAVSIGLGLKMPLLKK